MGFHLLGLCLLRLVVLVGLVEKVDEEEEIRRKEEAAKVGCIEVAAAVLLRASIIMVNANACAVVAGCNVQHKLGYLQGCEILLPPNGNSNGRHKVVVILQEGGKSQNKKKKRGREKRSPLTIKTWTKRFRVMGTHC